MTFSLLTPMNTKDEKKKNKIERYMLLPKALKPGYFLPEPGLGGSQRAYGLLPLEQSSSGEVSLLLSFASSFSCPARFAQRTEKKRDCSWSTEMGEPDQIYKSFVSRTRAVEFLRKYGIRRPLVWRSWMRSPGETTSP